MARSLVRASLEGITTAIGAIPAFGPGTAFAVVRKASDPAGNQSILTLGTGTNFQWIITSSNQIMLWNGAATSNALTLTAAEGWACVAVTKATGTIAPRFHKFVEATRVWSHAVGGTALANTGAPGTSAYIGAKSGLADCWDGDIAAAGIWNIECTDAQVEELGYAYSRWRTASLKAMWILDQQNIADPVVDLSGGGANQSAITGTTISTTDPEMWVPPPFKPALKPNLAYMRKRN